MDPLKRRYLVYQLMSTLDWMGRSSDWQERSLLLTRACGIIRNLGEDRDIIFEMDVRYLTNDYNKFRVYRAKLNDAIDIEDQTERENAVFEFYSWLHEIGLLRNDE